MNTESERIHNIALKLREVAGRLKEKPAIIEAASGKTVSFAAIERKSDVYAWRLHRSGIEPSDRVMLMVKPSADFISLSFALFKLGAPVILIDPGMGYRNLLRCIEGVRPKALIGIPQAHLFFRLFRNRFARVTKRFCLGSSFGLFGIELNREGAVPDKAYPVHIPKKDDLAAIIFTTGSTGPPKGVRFEHAIFAAQLEQVRNYYTIREGDVDQPAFPLFALFSTTLGACAVIPDMDASKPARVDPAKFICSLEKYQVTYSFASPALWRVVADFCRQNGKRLTSLRKVLMAGAPVPGELLALMHDILPDDAEIHVPYGATESLPIVSIEAKEVVDNTWPLTRLGWGTCVGKPLPGISVEVIRISDAPFDEITEDMLCDRGEIGELMVAGDVVTRAYDHNEHETRLAKTRFRQQLYHRMGDTGYIDEQGRIWFCGRKAHRVVTGSGVKYSVCCEAIVNEHPDIRRSALVGVGSSTGRKIPVLVLESNKGCRRPQADILREVRELAAASELTADISHFLFHQNFPVDIRHNAKIFREKLAVWAEKRIPMQQKPGKGDG